MGRVEGKACVVTGAGSGIGKAIAERLAEEGGRVICVDLSGDTATQTADGIRSAGGIAEAVAADVSDPAQETPSSRAAWMPMAALMCS